MDKYRGITRLPLAESRINHLFGRLSGNRALGSYRTQEELTRAYADLNLRILDGFEKRVYELPRVVRGAPVSEDNVNLALLGFYSEVMYLLDAVRGSAEMAEENYNYAIALVRRLQADLKYCKQQLSTYSLYATQYGDNLHFGETFSNETNIDRGSSLLGQEECFIDLAEGTVSLPRLEEADEWTITDIQIGESSNANLGNNVEANVPVRGAVKSMFDGNVDTWTEFEKVVVEEDDIGLKLELKVILDDVQPVNGLKIHPVFFGARTPFDIPIVEVSQDGRTWISLKNDVRVADFLDEDPAERYHLSPHSSKFAGEFNITFAPRFVKFIRLLIRQTSTIPIKDTYGTDRLRYAVGIREVAVLGHKYSTNGELVSKRINFMKDIGALGIQSLVDPPSFPSEVGGAEYYISYDDGASWNQLTSLEEASIDIPEILYPPEGTQSVRYKLHLQKNELAFAQQESTENALFFSERFGWSPRRPFVLSLFHTPVSGTITVCDPEVASRGKIYPRTPLGNGVVSSLVEARGGGTYRREGNTQLRLRLPLKSIKDPSTLFVYVNNKVWYKVTTVSDFVNAWHSAYVIERDANDEDWEVVFGNGDASNPLGAIPGPGDKISLYFSEEQNVVEGLVAPYSLKLDYPSDGIKTNTIVRFYGGNHVTISHTLATGVKKFDLPHQNIFVNRTPRDSADVYYFQIGIRSGFTDAAITHSGDPFPPTTGTFRNFKTFVNGSSELTAAGDWTVDAKAGILYTYDATESGMEYTASYRWEDAQDLSLDDWDFVDGKLDEIQIYESGYKTQEAEYFLTEFGAVAGDTSVKAIYPDSGEVIRGIVSKSLRVGIGRLGLGNRLAFETAFIDGRTEFLGRAKIQDEDVPVITSDGTNIASFGLTHWQNLVTTSSAFFDDATPSYFKEEKGNYISLTTQGDYYFDALGTELAGAGYIYVHMGGSGVSLPAGYHVSYQYYDEGSRERMKGAYSVDSAEGVIYFAEPLTAADVLKWVRFKYTPYRVRYNVSAELEEGTDYEVDIENSQITLFSEASGAREEVLAVNYKYQPEQEETADLAPYFSPLVRALDIRVS